MHKIRFCHQKSVFDITILVITKLNKTEIVIFVSFMLPTDLTFENHLSSLHMVATI